MHLIEQYALASSSKIEKPYILPKYFPLNIDKYITFHFSSKGAKTYDYANEVVELLSPILSKENIKIVQIGQQKETPINGCVHLMGQTNIGQIAFLLQNSLLHCGVDSFPIHIASSMNKKIVGLYSSNHTNCVKPYWGDSSNQILLEPDRIKYRPSFSLEEHPKSINTIFPEVVAKSICRLLGLEFSYPFKTISIGLLYPNKILESALTDLVDVKRLGAQNLILRYDINANLAILHKQLELNPCQIVTNVELPIKSLLERRQNVLGLIVKVTANLNPNFIKTLIENKIPYQLISELPIEELNPLKLNYLDYGIITRINSDCPEKLKDKKLSDLHFKSGKLLLGRGKFYSGLYEYMNENPILNPTKIVPHQINVDSKHLNILWSEAEHCIFLEKSVDKTT